MIRKFVSFAVVALVFQMLCVLPVAAATGRPQDGATAKVKAQVAKHEQKRDKVSVKLKDGSKLKGRITQRDEDAFTVTDAKSGATRSLTYTEVAQVKSSGGLSTLAKVGIAIGIGAAVTVAYVVVAIRCNEVGCL
jgi:small nuclear ribonucleoprotein (snRNP)-like protein